MAFRNIVKIDEDKCDGCGLCAKACAEGAIEIIDGKAKLISETYCDGLGACIGHCPQDAITIEQKDVKEFDEEAVKAHLAKQKNAKPIGGHVGSFVCPGMMTQQLRDINSETVDDNVEVASQLSHWPVQLTLVSPIAPYFKGANILLVADCVPFAMGDFHNRLLKGRSVVVGCPKLDEPKAYIEKLASILKINKPSNLTVVHMIVPCCSGLTRIADKAIALSGVNIEFEDVTIGLKGDVVKSEKIGAGEKVI